MAKNILPQAGAIAAAEDLTYQTIRLKTTIGLLYDTLQHVRVTAEDGDEASEVASRLYLLTDMLEDIRCKLTTTADEAFALCVADHLAANPLAMTPVSNPVPDNAPAAVKADS